MNRRVKIFISCWIAGAVLCGLSGCLATAALYYVEPDTINMATITNALFFLLPLVTAVVVIGMCLTAIGFWFLQSQD